MFALDAVTIGAGGTVTARVDNAGTIMGGSGNLFSNAGFILGGAGLSGSNQTGGRIDYSGTIHGLFQAALHLDADSSTTVTNTGVLRGVARVELVGATAHLFNAGQIISTTGDRAAVDAVRAVDGFSLRNSGDISGPVTGLLGLAFADAITSTGTVEGLVDLGPGADRSPRRTDLLHSKISGGIGVDLIQCGRGDDLVDGGVGNGTLAGNAGDDCLTDGAGADTFLFARRGEDDTIADFQHGIDKVNLKAFRFANFAAVSAMLHAHRGEVELDLTSHRGGTVQFAGPTPVSLTAGDFLL